MTTIFDNLNGKHSHTADVGDGRGRMPADAIDQAERMGQLDQFAQMVGPRQLFLQAFPSRHYCHVNVGDGAGIDRAIRSIECPTSSAIFWGINRMREGVTRAPANEDIERRTFLFLDVDHPDHDLQIPATHAGRELAFDTFKRINAYLLSRGWPAPIKIDSGNGPHGYWRIDLPNDAQSDQLIGQFLGALHATFGPLVDTANKDPRRLGRVPGTMNRRGECTAERRHRPCRIVAVPEDAGLVTAAMIQAVIDDLTAEVSAEEETERVRRTARTPNGEVLRPSDDFNRQANWAEILLPESYKLERSAGHGVCHWTRPGKESGLSATTGFCKSESSGDMLYMFSSNAPPFSATKSYSKFAAYAMLKHNGDFSAAAKALAAKGYGTQKNGKPSKAAEPITKPVKVDDHIGLILTDARKTKSGKINAQLAIERDGIRIDMLTATTAAFSRQNAARAIRQHAPTVELLKIELLIGTVLTHATEMANVAQTNDGELLRDIVSRIVTLGLQPAFRTPTGIFSESRGQELRRMDIVTATPTTLIDAASTASNIARHENGEPNRFALVKAVRTELEILFSDWMLTLPTAANATLLQTSAAAAEFRCAVNRVLTTPKTWTVSREDGFTQRSSLISRAVDQIRSASAARETKSWKQVLNAVNFWWRKFTKEDGEEVVLIAMTWEAFHQVGITMPSVHDQKSFVMLGTRYGVIDPDPPKSKRTNHNNTRIAVLKRQFIVPLLGDADAIDDEVARTDVDNNMAQST